MSTPKRTYYLTGESSEVVDEWLRGDYICLRLVLEFFVEFNVKTVNAYVSKQVFSKNLKEGDS